MADAAPGGRTPLDPPSGDRASDDLPRQTEAGGPDVGGAPSADSANPADPRPGDLYGALGVSANASLGEIKRAYHREAKRWHPDRFARADLALYARAGRRMRQLTDAYRVLSDPLTRAAYDATLRDASGIPTGPGGVASSIVGGYSGGVSVDRDAGDHATHNPNGAGQFFAALAAVVGLALLVGMAGGAASNVAMMVFSLGLVITLGVVAALFWVNSPTSRWATEIMEGEPRGFKPRPMRRRQPHDDGGVRFTTTEAAHDATDEAKAFERLVADALVTVPDEFESYMRNIVVEVEDEPSAETLRQAGVPEGFTLLGLYRGVPLHKRGMSETAPDVITIFRGPIERHCGGDPDRIREQARATTLHELAHHFGIDHDEMPDWVK